jgi:signal peptidase I
MGDNRTRSRDSRYFKSIPDSLIVGRAFVRVWPINALGLL